MTVAISKGFTRQGGIKSEEVFWIDFVRINVTFETSNRVENIYQDNFGPSYVVILRDPIKNRRMGGAHGLVFYSAMYISACLWRLQKLTESADVLQINNERSRYVQGRRSRVRSMAVNL